MNILKRFTSWVNKNKLVLILLIIIGALFIVNKCTRNQINEDWNDRIEVLDVENNILADKIKARDSIIKSKDSVIKKQDDYIIESIIREAEMEVDFGTLEDKYGTLADSIGKIPVDTSYQFLTEEAYPFEGPLKYPFNEKHVKGIHVTFLEKVTLVEMKDNLSAQIIEKDYQLNRKDTIVYEQAEQILLMSETRKDLDQTIANKDEEIKTQDKQIKKANRRKNFWQIVSLVMFGASVGIAVGGG